MQMKFFRSLGSLVLVSIFAFSVIAQTAGKSGLLTPFGSGETLTYEGKISRMISPAIAIADLSFTIEQQNGTGNYLVKAEARSKGTLLKIFKYSFQQELESTIGGREFRALKTVKHDVQKDRIRNSEAVFDYGEARVKYTETDPNDPMRAPRTIASQIDGTTHDLVSGLYSLRLLPLAIGRTFELKVSDSGLVYNIPVKVTGRERQKSVLGKIWCLRVEPDIFGPGRFIEQDGSMVIWMTDDARKIPVRSIVKSPVGKIDIKLKSAKNLK